MHHGSVCSGADGGGVGGAKAAERLVFDTNFLVNFCTFHDRSCHGLKVIIKIC